MSKLEYKMDYLDPNSIEFDKNNPRGLSPAQITNDPNFEKLVSSIKEYGILEPLIVKPNDVDQTKFILVDGERRLRATSLAKLTRVPVIKAHDEIDGRILAYHVQMLRQNWSKAAETKAIKKLISDFNTENPDITDVEIRKKLIAITKHTDHELTDIMRLTKYKVDTIDKVLSKDLHMSYLVQIEASFMAPMKKKYPDIVEQMGEEEIREILVNKAIDGKLVNTRYLMDEFKVVFQETSYAKKIGQLLINFLITKTKAINEVLSEFEKLTKSNNKEPKKETASAKSKPALPGKNKAATVAPKPIKVTKKTQTQIDDVREKFENIGASLTHDEVEYIGEALSCLEKHCFKAAILMIWAASISRILMFIEKDITDFNNASKAMESKPKSIYKHIAKQFQKNATSIDEIRVNSNDRQLLSYIYFKNLISETQCKKLLANYNTRCDCAHPTDIKLSPNEVISVFDNIHDLIFSNKTLK